VNRLLEYRSLDIKLKGYIQMRKRMAYTLIFNLSILSGCFIAGKEQEDGRSFKMFSRAYQEFKAGHYQNAVNLFDDYVIADTSLWYYESFAFMAECHHKLGQLDSAKGDYAKGIESLKSKRPESRSPNALNELTKWFQAYPQFPSELNADSGFVLTESDPVPIFKSQPTYPLIARRTDLEGNCFVKVLVDENGEVIKCITEKSTDEIFIQPSEEAAKTWRFVPYKRFGRPAKVWVAIPFRFRLTH
jgi:TonB family protein